MPREKANDYQVDGVHYRTEGVIQHWDFAASQNFDYFQGQITKYVTRWRKKNGLKDLKKAMHFLQKYIEVERPKINKTKLEGVGEKVQEQFKQLVYPDFAMIQAENISFSRPTGMHHPFGYNEEDDE